MSKRGRKRDLRLQEERRRRRKQRRLRRANRLSRRLAGRPYVVCDVDLGPCPAWPCGRACPCADFALCLEVV